MINEKIFKKIKTLNDPLLYKTAKQLNHELKQESLSFFGKIQAPDGYLTTIICRFLICTSMFLTIACIHRDRKKRTKSRLLIQYYLRSTQQRTSIPHASHVSTQIHRHVSWITVLTSTCGITS